MKFIGFFHSNRQARAASQQIRDQMYLLFDYFTMVDDETAQTIDFRITAKSYLTRMENVYSQLDQMISVDMQRIRAHYREDRILDKKPIPVLSNAFMDSCMHLNAHYCQNLLSRDVLAVFADFADNRAGEMRMTMVNIEALRFPAVNVPGLAPGDIDEARQKAPAYLKWLEANFFTAISDVSPSRQAARAMRNPRYAANSCALSVYGVNSDRQVLQTYSAIIHGKDCQECLSASSYAHRLRMGFFRRHL